MEQNRTEPENLISMINSGKTSNPRGRLKIFFGYAAGVGKTFAMLSAAHTAKEAGVDVVAGYVEPHDRPETMALLKGLEILPPLKINYKGLDIKEFDLDGALKRNPGLILVDELAHNNAEGCRHLKRYDDVEELLNKGIDVYTTINVQHLESLNDIIESVTGVAVRERIPDSVFDNAYSVELVDIEPDDLIERLNNEKIYKRAQAQKALDNFFIKENLVALREVALRRTADHVNREQYRGHVSKDYFTNEHILLCLSSSPSNPKVIRTGARMADAFHGHLTALFVETSSMSEMSLENKNRLKANLRLAERMGAKIVTVYGDDVPHLIAEYAKVSGVSRIVIGHAGRSRFKFLKRQNFFDRLTELAPNLDIHVIPNKLPLFVFKRHKLVSIPRLSIGDMAKSLGILVAATLIGLLFNWLNFSEANIIMVYILGVLFTALITEGKLYSAVFSMLGVLTFNFFFTDPYLSFEAHDPGYPVTFLIMFLASLLTSTLTTRVKLQTRQASLNAYRTEVLLDTSQKLQRAKDKDAIFQETARQIVKLLNRHVVFYPVVNDSFGEPIILSSKKRVPDIASYTSQDERGVAMWVHKNNKHAGATTNTLPGARCLYLPVGSNDKVFAVLGVAMETGDLEAFDKNLLIAMIGECALALEKEEARETKNQVFLQAKQEKLRVDLLRAISHDLRTPLSSISGDANLLLSNGNMLSEDKKQELYADIYDDSIWLINLVENILAVTRLDGGSSLKMEPELLEEVISEALTHISRRSVEYTIDVNIENDLLMAKMDSALIIQVIINIVDNAIKHTAPGSDIVVSAAQRQDVVEIEVADNGGGIPEAAKNKLFNMFFTADAHSGDSRRGLGLGLYLCKSIINAHGGEIYVKDNLPKGTVVTFTLQAVEAE